MTTNGKPTHHIQNRQDPRPTYSVFTVRERPKKTSYFTKIGRGFTNRDGSINLLLDALPLDAKLHIRLENSPRNDHMTNQQGTKSLALRDRDRESEGEQ